MLNKIGAIKKNLTKAIFQLCEVSWMFVKDPERDFIKKRKLPINKVISFILVIEQHKFRTLDSIFSGFLNPLTCRAYFVKNTSKTAICLGGASFRLLCLTGYAINLLTLEFRKAIFYGKASVNSGVLYQYLQPQFSKFHSGM